MHGSISDEVVKNLNKLINSHQTNKFRKAFNNLSTNHKNQYIEHVKAKPQGSLAMSGILNSLRKDKGEGEALKIFKESLQKDKESAFNTLDCINPKYILFKTLFGALDKNQYIEHVKAKPQGSSAMSGILNSLRKDKGEGEALSIFNQLPQEFAFNTLDRIDPTSTLFKTLFGALDKNQYIEHVKAKPQGSSAMSGILNSLRKDKGEGEALSIFNQLPQEFAFNTLDRIDPTSTLFKTLFGELDKNQYIEHVKAKPQGSSAMSGILNSLRKDKGEGEALSIFNQLPQEFAFNTLDRIDPTSTLFKTLFDQLNAQQKEEYRVHLKTKSTAKAKLVLKNFYLNNQ